jgi:hypothetical protein
MLAPHVGLLPLLRWAQGPLSVPYRPGIPTYQLQDKTRGRLCIHTLPSILWFQIPPPY